jgi:hypothetical protein
MDKNRDSHEKGVPGGMITVPLARNKNVRDKLGKDRKLKMLGRIEGHLSTFGM